MPQKYTKVLTSTFHFTKHNQMKSIITWYLRRPEVGHKVKIKQLKELKQKSKVLHSNSVNKWVMWVGSQEAPPKPGWVAVWFCVPKNEHYLASWISWWLKRGKILEDTAYFGVKWCFDPPVSKCSCWCS